MTPRVDHGEQSYRGTGRAVALAFAREEQEDGDETVRLGRAGQPVEAAPAYVYFASQESGYVSGEVIGVTGGMPLH